MRWRLLCEWQFIAAERGLRFLRQAWLLAKEHASNKVGFNSCDLPAVIDFGRWTHQRAALLAAAQISSETCWEGGGCGRGRLTAQIVFPNS